MALMGVWASQPFELADWRLSLWRRAKTITSTIFSTRYCVLCALFLFLPCLLAAFFTRGRAGPNRTRFRGFGKSVEFVVGEGFGSYYYWVTYRSGTMMEGQLQGGRKHGKTKIVWPNGDRFVGRYQNGKANGRALQLFNDGCRYKGAFRNGKRHGEGNFVWADGSEHHGQFKKGLMHGIGTCRHFSGEIYVGPYRNGKRHGIGSLTTEGGETQRCEYRRGELVRWLDDDAIESEGRTSWALKAVAEL